MRTSLFAFAAVLSLPVTAHAAAERYMLDPSHTNVLWHANHMGFSTPSGKFTDVTGTLMLDEQDPSQSSLEVTVKPGSVLTGIPKFDDHLKGPDFFNVEKHPAATFKSSRVEVTGKETAKVHGDFTLLGKTMPLVLDVKLNKIGENPMSKVKTAGFSATGTVVRSQYGMNYGLPMVGDEVKLTIEAEATKAE